MNANTYPLETYTSILLRPCTVCRYLYRIFYILVSSDLAITMHLNGGNNPQNCPFFRGDLGPHLIHGSLDTTQQPVLSNVAPPLCRKVATDKTTTRFSNKYWPTDNFS